MSSASRVSVESFAAQCMGQMIPLSKSFSYFSAIPLEEQLLKRLLYDPIASVPPKIGELLPVLQIVVVPFLEKQRGAAGTAAGARAGELVSKLASRPKSVLTVVFQRPAKSRRQAAASLDSNNQVFLFLAVKDEDMGDHHYYFYRELALLVVERMEAESLARFRELVREELRAHVNGEVDDDSWQLKEQILRRQSDPAKGTKLFERYSLQALRDTATLYLHGLCCDIDVEAGPRQLPTPRIRRRLLLLRELMPPPSGFALFPEELGQRHR